MSERIMNAACMVSGYQHGRRPYRRWGWRRVRRYGARGWRACPPAHPLARARGRAAAV